MQQLPVFISISGKPVILLGEGEAADAKRRLLERAGGVCCDQSDSSARLAFIAIEDATEATAAANRLKSQGLLVNVVDRPELCDFTVPAIVDRDPLLVAVGTGGASAGLAKMVRQAIERLLPARLGELAIRLQNARAAMRAKWPDGPARRRQIDAALSPGSVLDPLADDSSDKVGQWLAGDSANAADQLVLVELLSTDPEDLTLRTARLLGLADHLYIEGNVGDAIINRARADAVRHIGAPPEPPPSGLVIHLRMRDGSPDETA